MSNEQLYLSVGVPVLFNGLLAIVLTTIFSSRFADMRGSLTDVRSSLEGRISDVHTRISDLRTFMEARFASIETRMATKEELRRVEEVLDARLRHVEEELAKR